MSSLTPVERLSVVSRVRQAIREGHVREIRQQAAVTQAELAASIGVSPSCVSHWESGTRLPREETALRYGSLLEMLGEKVAP